MFKLFDNTSALLYEVICSSPELFFSRDYTYGKGQQISCTYCKSICEDKRCSKGNQEEQDDHNFLQMLLFNHLPRCRFNSAIDLNALLAFYLLRDAKHNNTFLDVASRRISKINDLYLKTHLYFKREEV